MASLGWAFHQVYSTRHKLPPVEQALNPIRRWLPTPVNFIVTSFQENWRCHIQGSLPETGIDDLSPPAACMPPFES